MSVHQTMHECQAQHATCYLSVTCYVMPWSCDRARKWITTFTHISVLTRFRSEQQVILCWVVGCTAIRVWRSIRTNVTCLISKQVVSYFFINERAPFPSPEGLHSASSSLALLLLTPSQLQPVQGGKMQSYTHANSIFDGPITNLLSILYVLIHISSRAHPKGGKMP